MAHRLLTHSSARRKYGFHGSSRETVSRHTVSTTDEYAGDAPRICFDSQPLRREVERSGEVRQGQKINR
jgi:hypothetical protein